MARAKDPLAQLYTYTPLLSLSLSRNNSLSSLSPSPSFPLPLPLSHRLVAEDLVHERVHHVVKVALVHEARADNVEHAVHVLLVPLPTEGEG
mgnify:CR=1 FL=1